MSSLFSKREIEELKPQLDKIIYKFLGFNEPALVTTAANCLLSGYDRAKAAKTIATLLEETKALKLADKIYDYTSSMKSSSKSSRKRQKDDNANDESAKKLKATENAPTAATPQLSSQQVNGCFFLDCNFI